MLKSSARSALKSSPPDDGLWQKPKPGYPGRGSQAPKSRRRYPRLTPEILTKLEAVIAGKATLLRKALGDSTLEIQKTAGCYEFPWFQIESSDEDRAAYTILIEKLIEFAGTLQRVTAKDKQVDNEKYSMRCFLLRLGFIGEEYKKARALLLRNLEGNSAFRSGAAPTHTPKMEGEQLSNQAGQE